MSAISAENYWQPVCDIVARMRCWVRLVPAGEVVANIPWSQLLTMPTHNYLESSAGPVPLQKVICAQIIPIVVRGGLAGRPLEFVDIQEQAVAAIRNTHAVWTLREEQWSIQKVFGNRQAIAIQVANPFKGASEK